jgi:hypothetical protein
MSYLCEFGDLPTNDGVEYAAMFYGEEDPQETGLFSIQPSLNVDGMFDLLELFPFQSANTNLEPVGPLLYYLQHVAPW